MAAALVATLPACGSDPPGTSQPTVKQRPAAAAVSPAAVVSSPSAQPGQSPAPSARPLPKDQATATASPSPATLGSYPPKDECGALPGFATFRTTLLGAIRKRDAVALTALADPAIILDFGGGSGPDELRKRLTDNPKLWAELAHLEPLGCAEDGGVVTMPWIFSRLPDSVDAYAAMLVAGQGVPLRAKPAADADKLATLDWALVEAVHTPLPAASRPVGYREVVIGSKAMPTRGFVAAAKLRSVLGPVEIQDSH